jgi:DNA-binding NarL/FixJ family response regulator
MIDLIPRVLVIHDDPSLAEGLTKHLSNRGYQVAASLGLEHARDVLVHWRPHVLVLVPRVEAERHDELAELRRIYPRLPVVVLTGEQGPDLLRDVEAFAPTLPVLSSQGLGNVEKAVAAACGAA